MQIAERSNLEILPELLEKHYPGKVGSLCQWLYDAYVGHRNWKGGLVIFVSLHPLKKHLRSKILGIASPHSFLDAACSMCRCDSGTARIILAKPLQNILHALGHV
jgi:hypothetical protein